jgi:hypothetical protein
MKKISTIIYLILVTVGLTAQTLTDAVRYSTLIPGGTARTMGVGGSFGAMGGDFGVLTINPAGIADFRSSDLSFSFSFNGGNTSSTMNGGSRLKTNHTNEPILENIGVVFHARPTGSSLVTSNLAIGLVQYNNFRQNIGYEGVSIGSITERFAQVANGISPDFFDPFEATLAYEAGAIYDFDGDLIYETDITEATEVFKSQDISRSGKINELAIAWAGKFTNNLQLGIGIGIPFISFEENKVYQESVPSSMVFNNLTFSEVLATSGTGFNFKLGAGYTIEKTIRLGVAYQSPTYFGLDDNYENNLSYAFTTSEGSENISSRSPDGRFEYKLTTPARLTGSIGAIIKTPSLKGFVNLDAQYINYKSNSFNLTSNNNDPGELAYEREVNTSIENELQSAVNLNLGGELAFEKFRVRGGLGMVGSPYAGDGISNFDNIYSLGGGFRGDKFYIDFAFQQRGLSQGYSPYQVIDDERNQLIVNETSINKVIFTVGFKL